MHTSVQEKAKKTDFAKDGLFDIPELWQEFMVKLEDFCPHVVFFLLQKNKKRLHQWWNVWLLPTFVWLYTGEAVWY